MSIVVLKTCRGMQ